MALFSPPQRVISAVESAVPGFWQSWIDAITWAHRQSSPWTVTSWWRSRAQNLAAGGHPFSQHLLGHAFDLAQRDARTQSALRAVGFHVLDERDHLHVQPWPVGSSEPLIHSLGLG